MSKKSLLIEFSRSPESRGCRTVEELELRFKNWMIVNNKKLITFGKDYFDNDFDNSVCYTIDLLEQNPRLMADFGFSYSDLEQSKLNTGYYERRNGKGSRGKNTDNGEGYSLAGQFKSYIDGIKGQGRGKGGKFSLSEFVKSPLGILIAIALVFTFIYIIFGEAIYGFITSGAIFKVICFVIAGFASFGIIKSKKLGWPIYIKAIVLFAIWIVLLNYNF